MQQRPRDPEPVAGQPKPRTVTTNWIDQAVRATFAITTAAAIIGSMIQGR